MIELLVVIAVISILMTMLLPSLSKARETSRRIACAGNQKQIGLAFESYSGDWGGYMPAGNTGYGTDPENGAWTVYDWTRSLYPYAVGSLKNYKYNPYSESLKKTAFFCQSSPLTISGSLTPPFRIGDYLRYGMNTSIFSSKAGSTGNEIQAKFYPASYAQSPSRNMLAGEVYMQAICYSYTYYQTGGGIGMGLISHTMGGNFLFADKHVEYRRYPSGIPPVLSGNPIDATNYHSEYSIFWNGTN